MSEGKRIIIIAVVTIIIMAIGFIIRRNLGRLHKK
jgi:putative Mn2+ efflux pump MntP